MAEQRDQTIDRPEQRHAGGASSVAELEDQIRATRHRLSVTLAAVEECTLLTARHYGVTAPPSPVHATASTGDSLSFITTTVRAAKLVWSLAQMIRSLSRSLPLVLGRSQSQG